jgi:hypothetical protein
MYDAGLDCHCVRMLLSVVSFREGCGVSVDGFGRTIKFCSILCECAFIRHEIQGANQFFDTVSVPNFVAP